MKKYFLIFKNAIREGMVYRLDTLTFFFSEILIFFSLFYLWSSAYGEAGVIGNYSLREMLFYYLAAHFILLTAKNNEIAWMIGDEIRMGSFNTFLVQPIDYSKYILSYILGKSFYNTLIFTSAFCIIFIIFGRYLDPPNEISRYIYFIISVGLGFFIHFFFAYIIGLSTFWLGMIQGINFSFWSISSLLEGSLIPLDLLPTFLQKINDFLPFKYTVFVPVSILNGKIDPTPILFLVPLLWILFLIFLSKIIFKRGVKKYEGFGI